MNPPPVLSPPLPPVLPPPLPVAVPDPANLTPAVSPAKTLRRLFLTLFLRGYSARGLRRNQAPTSVARKLSLTLVMYALAGLLALVFLRQSVFALSLYLHAMTLIFLGMFIAASAGEILFNQSEADILLHRPVEPRALLWAKIGVLVQVSLWLTGGYDKANGSQSPGGGAAVPGQGVVEPGKPRRRWQPQPPGIGREMGQRVE